VRLIRRRAIGAAPRAPELVDARPSCLHIPRSEMYAGASPAFGGNQGGCPYKPATWIKFATSLSLRT
jgi:hypothetical protein